MKIMQDTEQLKNYLADDLSLTTPTRKFDDSIGDAIYQVKLKDDWVETTESIFRSWTGLRRINGEDHHGPIYNFGTDEALGPYTGNRACGCSACQAHTEAKFKKN